MGADIVGLHLNPPENAVVVCMDEKPCIQAVERQQGWLRLPDGKTMMGFSDRYRRNVSSTPFAALEVATGQVAASSRLRRRRREFLDFMNEVVAPPPRGGAPCRARQPEHALQEGRPVAEETSARPFPPHPDQRVMAEPGGGLHQHPVRRCAPGGQL